MYWFKRKYRQIKRTLSFLPIIWKGYDWDYSYAIEVFKHQLKRMADEMESDRANTVSAPINAKKIRTAIRLMDKVYDEGYAMEHLEAIENLYGKTHYDFVELEETSKHTGEPLYELKRRNERVIDDKHQQEVNEVRDQMRIQSLEKQKRAHKLLWDFIEHNIKRWWD